MIESVYEKHSYEIYKGEKMPFIFHFGTCVQTGFLIPVNWHENPEFLRCKSGRGEVFESGESFQMEANDIISINPNTTHGVFSLDNICYDCLIVDYQFCKDNGIDIDRIYFEQRISEDQEALRLFDKAREAFGESSELQTLKARSCVLNFLLYLCENYTKNHKENRLFSGMEEIKRAMIYIRNNYKRDITLNEVAAVSGFSVYHFSREFKKVTGQTFVTFLNTVRCENAAKKLRHGMSVTETCFACGFKDISHFSRTFAKIMGVNPSALHKQE